MRTFQHKISSALFLIVLIFLSNMREAPADELKSNTQATMQEIFRALTEAFPLSLNEQQFQDPINRPRILSALHLLSKNAAKLDTHGRGLNLSFDSPRRSLVSNARDAVQLYEQGQYKASRFVLHELTENCFVCHSKLPSYRYFDLGKRFIENVNVGSLPIKDQVRLEVAARQFDMALETYETIFHSPSMTAGEIDLLGAFEDYLKICIRVYNDFPRAITALEEFQQRSDVHPYLANYLVNWVEALKELQLYKPNGNELTHSRELIQNAQLQNRFPADRRGLVYFVVASSLLHRYVATHPTDKTHLAEAYYLLGIAESYIRSSWIPETEFFLETAIRLDPTSSLAEKAYTFLEEYTLSRYTGSSGVHLPSEVQTNLNELHQLIKGTPN